MIYVCIPKQDLINKDFTIFLKSSLNFKDVVITKSFITHKVDSKNRFQSFSILNKNESVFLYDIYKDKLSRILSLDDAIFLGHWIKNIDESEYFIELQYYDEKGNMKKFYTSKFYFLRDKLNFVNLSVEQNDEEIISKFKESCTFNNSGE
ncbi:uncharacterized protein VNE69_05155 [Vairimorpha necatrix]|uniref:Uncharacterized protein n=1 Tax=Vairimorpha necatrix TaxID=6039 RepID=A0AAX4JC87_9MICR